MTEFHFQPISIQHDFHYATPWRTTALDGRLQTRLVLRSSTPLTLSETLSQSEISHLRQQGVILSNEFRSC
ncbi:hypothetical protein DZ860_16970 [Vibrio sinensis]|uniref:Uncharacterized protein n=1 Tax=Vibrio sinensis TaxID=2302434 RepID=A0A3A6QYT8_9VIBR|nr:hypothetical protein [Vibrio sinensis]RJX68686.1 hypothetical protein DZ860_16970 [Vibrio sinensis]